MKKDAHSRVRSYNKALYQNCLLAVAQGYYNPAQPLEATEEALFFVWERSVRQSVLLSDLHAFAEADSSEKRSYFPPESLYSYIQFRQDFLRKARAHQRVVLN